MAPKTGLLLFTTDTPDLQNTLTTHPEGSLNMMDPYNSDSSSSESSSSTPSPKLLSPVSEQAPTTLPGHQIDLTTPPYLRQFKGVRGHQRNRHAPLSVSQQQQQQQPFTPKDQTRESSLHVLLEEEDCDDTPVITIRTCRRTPYYPPNSSQSNWRGRAYMNRGPHYVANWTPLWSLTREDQMEIQGSMTMFRSAGSKEREGNSRERLGGEVEEEEV